MTDLMPTLPNDAPPPLPLADLADRVQVVRQEISRAFIGQDEVLDQLLLALLGGGHVLIEGLPGLGKTLLVRALAAVMHCQFARVQFTPDLMPSDVSGHAVYDPKAETFTIRRGPVFTNLLLADEINRAPAKTQSALLEAMQERQVTIEGNSFPLAAPFMAIATQNPVEQEGTYPLPEAQLDRFLLKIQIGYPTLEDEVRMVGEISTGRASAEFDLAKLSALIGPDDVVAMQQAVSQVHVDDAVLDYAVRLVRATREWPGISMGAGPRGSLALVRLARAQAAMEGRDFVVPDDVRGVVLPALRHRIALSPELQLEGQTPDAVLSALRERVRAPQK